MSIRNKVFVILALIVGLAYMVESILTFRSEGVTGPLLVKLAIAIACGAYVWRTVRPVARESQGADE